MKAFGVLWATVLMSLMTLTACDGLAEAERRFNVGVDLQLQGRLEQAIPAGH